MSLGSILTRLLAEVAMPTKIHGLLLHRALALLVCASFTVISHEVNADMFDLVKQYFKQYDVHLSSEVHGTISKNGVPLKNVKVDRALHYDKEYLDKTYTDSKGQFSFPEKVIKSRRPGRLLDETRTRNVITVVYEGETYVLWYANGGIQPKQAIAERLKSMKCELTTPETAQVFDNVEHPDFPHAIHSVCRWD